MKYDNSICPVCGERFNPESDVVVCPDCGTPHHRSCYEELGHCKNLDKHEDGFEWHLPEEVSTDKKDTDASNVEQQKVFFGGAVNQQNAPNGTIPGLEIDKDGRATPVYRAISGGEKIGDSTVSEYGRVVKKNIHKYIPRFIITDKTGRKVSWNWAAFLFGPVWLLYRKMYKYGIIALLLTTILPLICIGDVIDYQEKYQQSWADMSKVLMSDSKMSEAEIKSKTDAIIENAPKEPAAMVISSYIQLALSIALGVYGNYLYMDHCSRVIKASDKLKENPEDRLKFLDKRGGTSILAVLLAYIALFAIVTAVTTIATRTGTDLATILRRYI